MIKNFISTKVRRIRKTRNTYVAKNIFLTFFLSIRTQSDNN